MTTNLRLCLAVVLANAFCSSSLAESKSQVVPSSTGDEMQLAASNGGPDYVGRRYGQAGLRLEWVK